MACIDCKHKYIYNIIYSILNTRILYNIRVYTIIIAEFTLFLDAILYSIG